MAIAAHHSCQSPPSYTDTYYEAMEKLSENKVDEAKGLFDQSEEQRPVVAGTINGKSFTGFSGYGYICLLFY